MKQHNNNKTPFIKHSLLSTILLCFALFGQCNAHFPLLHNRHANPPEASHSLPYSDTPIHGDYGAPQGSPTPSHDHDYHGNGEEHSSSSFSSAFSSSFTGILRGTLRGHSLTMPQQVNGQNQHNHALKQICGHTDYPDVCVSTITPHLNDQNFDIMNVLQAAIKACSIQVRITLDKVSKQAPASPETMGASLYVDCREQYSSALDSLTKASNAIPARDLGTVTIMLSAVIADVSTCESGFDDSKSSYSFRADSDGLVWIMASNCLAIAHSVPH